MTENKNIYGVNERAFFLDCGRKYFSPKWFEKLIPILKEARLVYAVYVFVFGHILIFFLFDKSGTEYQ